MGWRMAWGMAAGAALAALVAGCTGKAAECTGASDCAALESGTSANAPRRATRYCESGSCKDAPAATTTVLLDLSTPRNVAVESIRYAVVATAGGGQTVDCAALKSQGLDGAEFNVALGGAKNTSSQGGTLTLFPDINLGQAPSGEQLLAVDGRSGTLGAGDRLAWGCTTINPSGTTTDVSLTLTPP